ncbi:MULTISPECIES: AraC family transcriptional regulator [Paenibacillus]|uniref:Transcriptional regulator n=1 Tax=Paenibacillus albilobatus TaxID=2716884 RepID=A0A919XEM4_9BACL|nr:MULTISPECIES: AraC family transcriptional regulator [Paenibacillus]GIO29595.1 transcriptional regulator [Paenibacillus albilobatus]
MDDLKKMDGFNEQKLYVMPDYRQRELALSELARHFYVSDIGVFPHAKFHYRERPEGCDAHILIYCTEGSGWIELEHHTTMQLTARHFAVIPAGIPHRYGASAHSPWSIHWLHLHGGEAASMVKMYGLDGAPIHLDTNAHSIFSEGFDQCYALLSSKTYSLPVQIHAFNVIRKLLSHIGTYSAASAKDQKKESYLENAIHYMNGRLDDSIKLSELAKHAGLSKQHLIYLFNKETGCPPIDFFLRMKMQKAAQMLSLTELTIKEIACSVGILDPYYFSRLFKKIMGISPTQYRNIPKG